MEIKYIDIHSHLNLSPLWEKREEIIARMREKGVGTIVIGVDKETSMRAIELTLTYPDVVLGATVGLHPTDNDKEVFDIDAYRELAKHPPVVAIGECGLDYFRLVNSEQGIVNSIKEKQKALFKQHIELAIETSKPLMIHARPSKGSQDAYEDVLEMLKEFRGIKANFHFFVGNIPIASQMLERGFTMSFDGPITFSRDYDELIKFLPVKSIMCETDAPFAAPVPYRGKTCEPWMVEEVYKKIAELKEMDVELVRTALIANTKKKFDIQA